MPTKKSSILRATLPLNTTLNQALTTYVAAAGAAGVCALSMAQSVEAKVVYTAANTAIPENTNLKLDLNHDGVNDFSFSQFAYGNWQHFYFSPLAKGNGALNGKQGAAALRAGVPIGPQGSFEEIADDMLAKYGGSSGYTDTSGSWNGVKNRYLGLRFVFHGKTHYGWARLTVTGKGGLGATLTGYAYETIPDKRILAGQTAESEETAANSLLTPVPREEATLALLASGAGNLALWRREDDAIAR